MPDCSRIDALVTPYVDGELPDADTQTIASHLAVCPPCRAKVAAEQSIRTLIHGRRRELGGCAPPALKAKCALLAAACARSEREGQVVAMPRRTRPSVLTMWPARLMPLGIAAALFLMVGTLVYLATGASTRVLAAELTADHEKCFRLNKLLGTHASASEVERQMASGFDWQMKMPDISSHQDINVVGSRPCIYGEGATAHIMFRQNGEPVSLFMLKGSRRASEVVEVFGHQCRIWSEGDRTFVLVARASTVPLEQTAALMRTTIR